MEQFLALLAEMPELQQLVTSVRGKAPCALVRVAAEVRPHLLHLLREQTGRDIFYVFSSEYHARRAAEAYVYPEGILLPAPQAELRPVEAQSAEVRHARVQALDRLHQKGGIVFASIESLLARMRPPEHFFAQ